MNVSISKIKLNIKNMLVANISVELEKPLEIIKYQVYLLNEYNEVEDMLDSFENVEELFSFLAYNKITIVEFIDETIKKKQEKRKIKKLYKKNS